MNILSSMVNQLSNIKTLEEEILTVLEAAYPEKLSCADIRAAIPNPPDRETLSREIFNLSQAGTIKRAGEIPAPPGLTRKSVAIYTLPHSETAPVATDETTQLKRVGRKDIIDFLSRQTSPVSVSYIADQLGAIHKSVGDALSQLKRLGTVDRVGERGDYSYFLAGETSPKKTTAKKASQPAPPPQFKPSVPESVVPPELASVHEFAFCSNGQLLIMKDAHITTLASGDAVRLKDFLQRLGPVLI